MEKKIEIIDGQEVVVKVYAPDRPPRRNTISREKAILKWKAKKEKAELQNKQHQARLRKAARDRYIGIAKEALAEFPELQAAARTSLKDASRKQKQSYYYHLGVELSKDARAGAKQEHKQTGTLHDTP